MEGVNVSVTSLIALVVQSGTVQVDVEMREWVPTSTTMSSLFCDIFNMSEVEQGESSKLIVATKKGILFVVIIYLFLLL